MALERRPTQTKVKHDVLRRSLGGWGSIISGGVRRQASRAPSVQFRTRLIYFDSHANVGRYLPDQGSINLFEDGSPLVGIHIMDDLVGDSKHPNLSFEGITILVEQDSKNFDELKESLRLAGVSNRIKIGVPVNRLVGGDIGLYHTDWSTIADQVLAEASQPYTYVYSFIDPYGPSSIPHELVIKFVKAVRSDVLLYWPAYDLLKKVGIAKKDEASSQELALIGHYNRMFQDDIWQTIARESEPQDIEGSLLEHYRKSLIVNSTIIVKHIRLLFEKADRSIYYLLHSTKDADGALMMNEVLHKAGIQQHALRSFVRADNEAARKGSSSMFDLSEYDSPLPRSRNIDNNELPKEILRIIGKSSVILKDIKKEFVNTDIFVSELASAINKLKKNQQLTFSGNLNNNTAISIGVNT